MDLVLKDSSGTDLMVVSPDSADFEWGDGGNDFELTFGAGSRPPAMPEWGSVYAYGTEYGGVLTRVESAGGAVKWSGPTWTGLLAGKVLAPDAGSDRLTVSGEANAVLAKLVARMGLTDVLAASSENSGVAVDAYGFELYCDGYTGVRGMLASCGAKLRIRHDGERAVLSALPAKNWGEENELVASAVDVEVDTEARFVNHLVARGSGEGQDRVSVELYLDASGNVSETQAFTGLRERAEYYDYTTADRDQLVEDGTKRLKEYYAKSRSVAVEVNVDEDVFDIGDTIAGADPATGVSAAARVVGKVLTLDARGRAKVSYTTG